MKLNQLVLAAVVVVLAQGAHAARKAPKAARAAVSTEATETFADEEMSAKLVVDSAPAVAAAAPAPAEPTLMTGPVGGAAPAATTSTAEATATTTAAAPAPTMAEVAKLPESQIPVLTGAKEAKKTASDGITRLLITLAVAVAGLGALLFGLKRYAAKRGPKKQSTKIQILTQHALGPKKSLAIIQVAGEAILIGVTDQNISMLKTLALIDDEIPETTPQNFDNVLDDYEDEVPVRGGKRRDVQEDFAVRGLSEIRDTVSSRIKNMKNL